MHNNSLFRRLHASPQSAIALKTKPKSESWKRIASNLSGVCPSNWWSAGPRFDHGAQYFTVRDSRFERFVTSWKQDGIVAAWKGRLCTLTGGWQIAVELLIRHFFRTSRRHTVFSGLMRRTARLGCTLDPVQHAAKDDLMQRHHGVPIEDTEQSFWAEASGHR